MAKKTNLKPSIKNNIVNRFLSPVKEFKLKHFLLLAIILLSALLRLNKSQELFFWHVDEDIIALTVKRILIDDRPQLIGFPVPGGIYLGPLIYYLLAVFYAFSQMNPSALPYFSAILSTITVILIYFVGKTIFKNKYIGLIAAFIYGFSFLVNAYSRIFSGLSIVGILSLLSYFLLFKLIKNKRGNYFFYLLLLITVAVQNEGSSFSILLLSAIAWFIYRFRVDKKQLKIGLLILLLSHIPLLIFNLRHNFVTITALINFLSKASIESVGNQNTAFAFFDVLNLFPKTLARIFYVSGPNNIAGQILPCSDLIAERTQQNLLIYLIALIFIGVFLITYIFKKNKPTGESIIFLHFLVMVFGLLIYNVFMKGYLYEWVTLIFFPGFSLIAASIIYKTFRMGILPKLLVLILLAVFAYTNAKLALTSNNSFGFKAKKEAVKVAVSEIGSENFMLDSIGSCFAHGYYYLFWYYHKEPVASYADEWFGEGIIKPKTDKKASIKVVMTNPSKEESDDFLKRYYIYKNEAYKVIKAGEIEVLFLKL